MWEIVAGIAGLFAVLGVAWMLVFRAGMKAPNKDSNDNDNFMARWNGM